MSKNAISKLRENGHRPFQAPSRFDLSHPAIATLEQERKRISRELHDETGQALMVLRLYLGMLAAETLNANAQLLVQQATELLDHTIGDLRHVITRLSPRILEEIGLPDAVRKEVRQLRARTGTKVHLDFSGDLGHLDREVEIALYRALQEALHNIARHSQAHKVSVCLKRENGGVSLRVQDDGVGFKTVANGGPGLGLSGMKERIAGLNGKVRIRSSKPVGTVLHVKVPAAPKQKRTPEEFLPVAKAAAASSVS